MNNATLYVQPSIECTIHDGNLFIFIKLNKLNHFCDPKLNRFCAPIKKGRNILRTIFCEQ